MASNRSHSLAGPVGIGVGSGVGLGSGEGVTDGVASSLGVGASTVLGDESVFRPPSYVKSPHPNKDTANKINKISLTTWLPKPCTMTRHERNISNYKSRNDVSVSHHHVGALSPLSSSVEASVNFLASATLRTGGTWSQILGISLNSALVIPSTSSSLSPYQKY